MAKEIESQPASENSQQPLPHDSILDTPISRRRLLLPIAGMVGGTVALAGSGGLAWRYLLNPSREKIVPPAIPEVKLPAELLSPEVVEGIQKEKGKWIERLKQDENMVSKATFDISGIKFTILSHADKIVTINSNGFASGMGALFTAAEQQQPGVYRDNLLKARELMNEGKFANKGLEVILAYSGLPNTYPSNSSPFAPIEEGETFETLASRGDSAQVIIESQLVVMYGMNAGAIEGKVERSAGGRKHILTPEQALMGATAHELGHALLRFMGIDRDQKSEEPFMRDGVEARVLEEIKANSSLPVPIKFPKTA
jgi:hypothetical protein